MHRAPRTLQVNLAWRQIMIYLALMEYSRPLDGRAPPFATPQCCTASKRCARRWQRMCSGKAASTPLQHRSQQRLKWMKSSRKQERKPRKCDTDVAVRNPHLCRLILHRKCSPRALGGCMGDARREIHRREPSAWGRARWRCPRALPCCRS